MADPNERVPLKSIGRLSRIRREREAQEAEGVTLPVPPEQQPAPTQEPQLPTWATASEAFMQSVPAAGETVGATLGAGLGTAIGRTPQAQAMGAALGGAAGAAAGQFAGDLLIGQEPDPAELAIAALAGGGPSAFVASTRQLARFLTGLRSVQRSVAQGTLRMRAHEAKLQGTFTEREIGNIVRRSGRTFTEMNMELRRLQNLTPLEIATEFGTDEVRARFIKDIVLDQTEAAVKQLNAIPESVERVLTDPELTTLWDVSQLTRARLGKQELMSAAGDLARSSIMRSSGAIGGMAAGASAATGLGAEGIQALAGVGGGAVVGLILGQMGVNASQRIIHNNRFRRWATGITPHSPLAMAATTFVTEVLMHSADEPELNSAKQFFDRMIDTIKEAPAYALGLFDDGTADVPTGPLPTGRPSVSQGFTPRGGGEPIPGDFTPSELFR